MNPSLTRASTCSTEPSLQRAVSKIWCFHSTVTVCQIYLGWYMLPVRLQPVPASFAVETDAASLWGRCVMEWKTAQTDGTRLDAVCLLPEDCRFNIKDMTCATLRFVCFFCLCLHKHAKHVASCRPGEVLCGNGQCRPQSSQCVSHSSCADSSEEGTCGE